MKFLLGLFVLAIAFIVLKLCAVIGWSWWLVTAPMWAPVVLVVFIVALVMIISFIFAVFYHGEAGEDYE